LVSKLARFAEDFSEQVRLARPDIPESLNDRAQDNWTPLFAIAEVVGGEWPTLARSAALRLSCENEQTQSISVELLADIQEVFQNTTIERISSVDLITALCQDEEKPWLTYNRGFPIKPRQVVTRLKEFGITSQTIRIGTTTAKGYMKIWFKDAFTRYLPSPGKYP